MKYPIVLSFLVLCCVANSQKIAIAPDKMNVFYLGVDNPITVAAFNIPSKSVVVKATNGKITGANGQYLFKGNDVGAAEITVYSKNGNHLTRLGSSFFRVKRIPPPVFKIGSGRALVSKAEIANQDYVRAELEGFDIDVKVTIDSFIVCIIPADTCVYTTIKNVGNKINDTLKEALRKLKPNDQLVFKEIYSKPPWNESLQLAPVFVTIKE